MKILLIIPSFYPATIYGGPIFSTLHACEALSALDDLEIYVSTTNANRINKLRVERNKWVEFNSNFFVKYYNTTFTHILSFPMFMNVWKDIKSSDVIQVQPVFNVSTIFALLYSKILLKPVLLSPRGSLCEWCLAQGSQFKKFWMKFIIMPISNYVHWHATSENEKKDILKLFPEAKVHVVSNGIDFSSFAHVNVLTKSMYMKEYTGLDYKPSKVVVSMGRLHKVKGFDILIKSFSKILKTYSDAVLLIAGNDVGEKENLKVLVKELGLEKNIFFVGEVSGQAKMDFLGNADLFVLPSYTENFGNVYIESLAAGTPIVASTGTPWQEVESADCGKWVQNNVKNTSGAILEMLNKDREAMRFNARALAQKYDWKNIALQFKEVFERMIIDEY